jgi:hypothetical protein
MAIQETALVTSRAVRGADQSLIAPEEAAMQGQAANDRIARLKSAELLSSTGALALGVGLGALLSSYVGRAAVPILVVGIASHGWGMLQKHRLERSEDYAPAWWQTALYRVCWAALALVLPLIAIKTVAG